MHSLCKHHCIQVSAFTMIVMERDYSPRFGENNCFLTQFPCKGSWSENLSAGLFTPARGAQNSARAAQLGFLASLLLWGLALGLVMRTFW